jgi:hypothetical protein
VPILLQSLGTAEMVTDMILGNAGRVDFTPFSIENRFSGNSDECHGNYFAIKLLIWFSTTTIFSCLQLSQIRTDIDGNPIRPSGAYEPIV